MFHDFGYVIISPQKRIVTETNYHNIFFDDTNKIIGSSENVFCIHKSKHELLKKLKVDFSQYEI